MLPMFWLAVLIGPCAHALGQAVDRGDFAVSAFSLLLLPCGPLLTLTGERVEAAAFSVMERPWLAGRLNRWQRLILPYKTAFYLTLGFGGAASSGVYLIAAEPAAATDLALIVSAIGGGLIGFALARLIVGIAIVRTSGLWRASRRAWLFGALVIVAASIANAAYSVNNVLDASTLV